MSIEKATEAILPFMDKINRREMAPSTAAPLAARAALPHLLEEPTDDEFSPELAAEAKWDFGWGDGSARNRAIRLVSAWVRRRNAPPEPPEPAGRYDWHKENWGESPIPRGEGWKWVRSHKSSSGDEDRYTVEWVRTAAPPVPDPRREAIQHVLREYPDRAPEIADRILSALDSLKGSQP
jgi:hypothetical protein